MEGKKVNMFAHRPKKIISFQRSPFLKPQKIMYVKGIGMVQAKIFLNMQKTKLQRDTGIKHIIVDNNIGYIALFQADNDMFSGILPGGKGAIKFKPADKYDDSISQPF